MTLKVGSLFSGIGGFDLGLQRAGMDIAWQVEIDDYCRAVLQKHWPEVPKYGDIRTVDFTDLSAVDVLCGGFPCQDISIAGRGAGLDGERSGLWYEYARGIEEARPSYVIIENSPVLRSRGLEDILRTLHALGYDVEWHCIPAGAIGAPHRRDRVWVIATASDTDIPGLSFQSRDVGQASGRSESTRYVTTRDLQHPGRGRYRPPEGPLLPRRDRLVNTGWWLSEPDVDRVAYGLPGRVDRIRALGNAVVPQIPEMIGRAIIVRHGS